MFSIHGMFAEHDHKIILLSPHGIHSVKEAQEWRNKFPANPNSKSKPNEDLYNMPSIFVDLGMFNICIRFTIMHATALLLYLFLFSASFLPPVFTSLLIFFSFYLMS